jgi:hypothetical protein
MELILTILSDMIICFDNVHLAAKSLAKIKSLYFDNVDTMFAMIINAEVLFALYRNVARILMLKYMTTGLIFKEIHTVLLLHLVMITKNLFTTLVGPRLFKH